MFDVCHVLSIDYSLNVCSSNKKTIHEATVVDGTEGIFPVSQEIGFFFQRKQLNKDSTVV